MRNFTRILSPTWQRLLPHRYADLLYKPGIAHGRHYWASLISALLVILMVVAGNTAQAQCAITLKTTVSGCYQDASNNSKAWVTVEADWNNGPSNGTITVTMGGLSRTIKTGTYNVVYDTFGSYDGNQTIVSQQVVAFELPADGSTQTINAQFSSSCKVSTTVKLPAACVPTPCASGKLGGQVFKDFNNNGTKEAAETIGLPSVAVTAYSSDGTSFSAVSDVDGNYLINVPTAKYPVRVEFSSLPAFAGQGSVMGTNTKSTVQFVSAAACNVNLGLLNPTDYCQDTPKIVVPCFVNGNPVTGTSSGNDPALVAFDYGTSGGKDASKITVLAKASQIGTTWGTAYDRYNNRIFTSAVVKRHAGLGPLGLGGIYVTNMATNTTTNYIDVATLGINLGGSVSGNPWFGVTNSSRGLNSDLTKPNYDVPTFANVGKVGIGDLEIAEDGQALFFVNLFDKKLYKLNISGTTPTVAGSWTIPNPNCAGGVSRPFATKIYNGKLYVGTVCDASTSKDKSDLRAYIYTFDVTSSTFNSTAIFEFPLTYPKGPVQTNTEMIDIVGFYPWTDTFADINTGTISNIGATRLAHPTPILTDIEIDIDGSIIIGLGDRTGMQAGFENYGISTSSTTLYVGFSGGDILRAQYSDGVYILENGGKLPGLSGAGVNNNQGIGFGEFYEDNFYNKDGKLNHAEVAFGGLALKPGSGEVVITGMDPVNVFDRQTTSPNLGGDTNTGGIRYLNNKTGTPPAGSSMGFVVYEGNVDSGTFGKSTGLGDLELTCGLLDKIEIGNRVWIDTDGNGIQDPDESPIAGVTVQLLSSTGSTTIASAVTDANGNYVFSERTATSTPAFRYGLNLSPSTQYIVRIPNVQGSSKQSILGTRLLTTANATGGIQPDVRDSDGILAGNNADVTTTTLVAGQNNHTYDFGFVACSVTAVAGGDVATCAGIGVVLSSTVTGGTAPITYAWSPASGLNSTTIASPTATPTTTTTYTLVATDASGCTAKDVTIVTVNPLPVANAGTDVATCAGTGVALSGTATSGTGVYTYSWAPATGLSSATIRNPTATPTATTTYTLTVTDAKGCKDTDVVLVTVNPKPIVTASAPVVTKATCNAAGTAANANASIVISGIVNGNTYTVDGGATQTLTGGTITLSGLANPAASKTYTIVIFNTANGLTSCSTTVTATLDPTTCTPNCTAPTASTPVVTKATCNAAGTAANANASIVISGIVNGNTYTVDGGATQTLTGGTITLSGLANPAASKAYTIVIFNTANGLTNCSTTVTATLDPTTCTPNCTAPTASTPVVTKATCNAAGTAANADASIVISGIVNGNTYTVDGGATQTITGGTITLSGLANPAASKTYTIVIFNTANGLTSCSTTVTATLDPTTCTPNCTAPTASAPVVTKATCNAAGTAANSDASIVISGIVNGNTYTVDGGATQTITGGVITLSGLANPAASKAYTIVIFNTANGLTNCSTTVSATLAPTTCTPPSPSLTVAVGTPVCNTATNNYTATGTVSLTNAVAGTLTITDNGSSLTTITVTAGQTTVSFPVSGISNASSHTVTATLNGLSTNTTYLAPASCTACTVNLTTTSLPRGKVGVAYNATLTASGGTAPYSFSVSGGTLPTGLTLNPTTGVISGTPTASGPFPTTITISDTKGCSVRVPLTVTQIDPVDVCALTVAVTPGLCVSATNQYSISGTVSFTSAVAATLTITDGTQSTTIAVAALTTSMAYSLTGLTSGSGSHLVVATLSGCATSNAAYTAPASCTAGSPAYAISKQVDLTRIAQGGVVTYTVSLTNTGNAAGTNVVIADQLSSTAVSFVGSATTSVGTFLPAGNSGNWTIPSLAAGQVATLAFKVQLNAEGITYNTATAPDGTTATVCTTVPFKVCASEAFEFRLAVAPGQTSYQWSKNGQPISGATTNVISVTAVGEYSVTSTNAGSCPDGSCCPFVIEAYGPLPSLSAVAAAATCTGGTPLNDAKITVVGSSTNAVSYNISMGSSFTASAPLFASNQPLAAVVGGVLKAGLANPASAPGQTYTIRVFTADGCFADTTVTVPPAQCSCPDPVCIPVTVRRLR